MMMQNNRDRLRIVLLKHHGKENGSPPLRQPCPRWRLMAHCDSEGLPPSWIRENLLRGCRSAGVPTQRGQSVGGAPGERQCSDNPCYDSAIMIAISHASEIHIHVYDNAEKIPAIIT